MQLFVNDLNVVFFPQSKRPQFLHVLFSPPEHSGYGSLGGTLGRRHAPDHYNIQPSDPNAHYALGAPPQAPPSHYTLGAPPRYTAYSNAPAAHPHATNSLRRNNQPGKLHFPKDYIRNGGSLATSNGGQYKPQSPTHTMAPVLPSILSTGPLLTTSAPPLMTSTTLMSGGPMIAAAYGDLPSMPPSMPQPSSLSVLPLEQRGHLV